MQLGGFIGFIGIIFLYLFFLGGFFMVVCIMSTVTISSTIPNSNSPDKICVNDTGNKIVYNEISKKIREIIK